MFIFLVKSNSLRSCQKKFKINESWFGVVSSDGENVSNISHSNSLTSFPWFLFRNSGARKKRPKTDRTIYIWNWSERPPQTFIWINQRYLTIAPEMDNAISELIDKDWLSSSEFMFNYDDIKKFWLEKWLLNIYIWLQVAFKWCESSR